MLSLPMPAPLENIGRSDEIGIHVGCRIHGRMGDAGLRSKMRHIGKPLRSKQPRHGAAVGDIASFEAKVRVGTQLSKPRLLETGVVIVVEVVDTDDAVAFTGKPAREMKSDETGCTGHKDGRAHAASVRSGRRAAAEKIAFDQSAYGVRGHDMNLLD